MQKIHAVFIDRSLLAQPEHTKPLMDRLHAAGYIIVMTTNLYGSGNEASWESRRHLDFENDRLAAQLKIDEMIYCPHLIDDQCECRRPGTALYHEVSRKRQIDLSQSFIISEKPADIQAGEILACDTILVGEVVGNSRPKCKVHNLPAAVTKVIAFKEQLVRKI